MLNLLQPSCWRLPLPRCGETFGEHVVEVINRGNGAVSYAAIFGID